MIALDNSPAQNVKKPSPAVGDLLNVQFFWRTKFTAESAYILSKFKWQQNAVFNQIYFNSTVFNIRLYKTPT